VSELLQRTLEGSLDRFKKLRIGQLVSDISDVGEVNVTWLDGEPGGQSNIVITYPGINNVPEIPYGVEIGHGKGTVGVFGFIKDNHAIMLATIISKVKNKKVGYDKTQKIRSGEFRATSKKGSKLYLADDGNVNIYSTNEIEIALANGAKLTFTSDGKINIDTSTEVNITCSKFTVKTATGVTTL
jgi:hypothetical protein